jgi:hypothetical protein
MPPVPSTIEGHGLSPLNRVREWAMLSVTVQDLGDVAVLRCEGRIVSGHEVDILRTAALSRANRRIVVLDVTQWKPSMAAE